MCKDTLPSHNLVQRNERTMKSKLLAVLFADVSDSTMLYQTQGDISAHKSISESLHCMKSAIESHGGTLLRTVGDSALASFPESDAACEAAVDMQRGHAALSLSVRVGFHYGEVIPDSGDVYGNAVNLAARVAAFAEADEICTTEEAIVRLSLKHRTNTHYLDNVSFKGVSQPMPVYRVNWKADSAHTVIITGAPSHERYRNTGVLELSVDGQRMLVDQKCPLLNFGRSTENDVVIDSELASRYHASIELLRGRYVLHDSSTNGTYVMKNGTAPEFVRRESIALDQSGAIGLGFSPIDGSAHVITYRVNSKACP